MTIELPHFSQKKHICSQKKLNICGYLLHIFGWFPLYPTSEADVAHGKWANPQRWLTLSGPFDTFKISQSWSFRQSPMISPTLVGSRPPTYLIVKQLQFMFFAQVVQYPIPQSYIILPP